MSVVSNASPLINLARIGKLDLLHQLYGEVTISEVVWQEVVVEGAGQPGAEEVRNSTWIKTRSVRNRQLTLALQQELDAGEAEAIVLALEIKAELLLMDERLGRDTARYLGCRPLGLVGVLRIAKYKGFIETVKPYLDALRDVAGFRISDALYERVLRDEKEIDANGM